MLIDWVRAIVLGVVEGTTEFLPISSTGHLLVAERLLGFDGPGAGTFAVVIQLGAVLAVLLYYAGDIGGRLLAARTDPAMRRFWMAVAVAFVPAAAIGFLLHGFIKQTLFASPALVAAALIAGGVVLIAVERFPRTATTTDLAAVSIPQAAVIGIAQIAALVPGVSRSGATIVGGLIARHDRPTATRFSFYLAIPTLGMATLFDLVSNLKEIGTGDLDVVTLALGTVTAGVVAWLSIGWLLRYVSNHDFTGFGWYRIGAGAVILALVAAGVI
jgi:undecaprenyl-diphosphatase